MKNKREYLQTLCNELKTDFQHDFEIEFRGRAGWWAVPHESRWFGDQGEYLGQNWQQAERAIRHILG